MVQDQESGAGPEMSAPKVAGLPTCGRRGLTRICVIFVVPCWVGEEDGRGLPCAVPVGCGVGDGVGSPLVGSARDVTGTPVGDAVGGGVAGSYLRIGVTVALAVMM